jgi:hypothetical protein
MTPPINIDGSKVTGITIDGTSVSEVTADGQTVFSEIPDSGDLQWRFDAREMSANDGDSVSTLTDLSGNNNDAALQTGSANFRAGGLAGVDCVELSDARFEASFGATFGEPYAVFALAANTATNFNMLYTDNPVAGSGYVGFECYVSGSYEWKINGASDPSFGSADTNAHVWGNNFVSGDGEFREDGTSVATNFADSGSNGLDGIAVGGRADGASPAGSNLKIVELLVYSADESGNFAEIEDYLDRDSSLV